MSTRLRLTFLFSLGWVATPLLAVELSAVVQTTAGPVQGRVHPTTVQYLGIPYAEPPLGELRWQPPRRPRSWADILDATQYRPHCLQSSLRIDQADSSSEQSDASEDCLFLNVYTPRETIDRLRPVMVWIHGGANVVGASETTDPTMLIETGDVVLVSLNYRLGPFGFLAHPALDAEDHPAVNYGVMDQQLALRWVRENIREFGGDPKNVTIFGVSAGGLNVTTHLISPSSAGLFHRAIIQSGGYQLDTPSLENSQKYGVAFAARAGCGNQTAACLRDLSAESIVAHAGDLTKQTTAVNQSTVDGRILPQAQRAALEAGRIHRVPVLLGSTSDEEPVFGCGALASMKSLSKWVPTYAYELSDPDATDKGAVHGADLRYLFDVYREGSEMNAGPGDLPEPSQRVARAMQLSWAAFAATGSPQTALIPYWPLASKGILRLEPSMPAPISHEEMSARLGCATDAEKNILPKATR